MISLQYVRALLEYDHISGNLYWLMTRGRAIKGNIAGRVSRDGYIQIGIDGKRYPAHRLGWLIYHGAWPKDQLDHINTIKTDNRISNLREATNQQNQYNRGLQSNNKSGLKGVSWNKAQKKWLARIRADKKLFHLGSFNKKEDAHHAYIEEAKRLHGEFERTAS